MSQTVSGLERATITRAMSSGVVRRPAGWIARQRSIIAALSGIFRRAGVSVTPARIAFTAIFRVTSSTASWRTVALEGGLRGRYRAVGLPDPVPARGRHREDVPALGEEAGREEVLHPVDERMRHDVERHVHLGVRDPVRGRGREERLERPEGERVENDVDPGPAPLGVEDLRHLGDRLGPLLVVGGVHVEEDGLRPGGGDLPRDPLDVGLGRLAVEVDAEDVASRPGEGEGRRLRRIRRRPRGRGPTSGLPHGPEC